MERLFIIVLLLVCIVLIVKYYGCRKRVYAADRNSLLSYVSCMALMKAIDDEYGAEKRKEIMEKTCEPLAELSGAVLRTIDVSFYVDAQMLMERIERRFDEYKVFSDTEKQIFG